MLTRHNLAAQAKQIVLQKGYNPKRQSKANLHLQFKLYAPYNVNWGRLLYIYKPDLFVSIDPNLTLKEKIFLHR